MEYWTFFPYIYPFFSQWLAITFYFFNFHAIFVYTDFRTGRVNILVATDVAARGLGKYGTDV